MTGLSQENSHEISPHTQEFPFSQQHWRHGAGGSAPYPSMASRSNLCS